MELAKYITASRLKSSTLEDLASCLHRWPGMEWQTAQGKMVRTETPVTMDNVTDSFLSV